MSGLTPMQARTLNVIRDLTRGGVSPSYRQIQAELGLKSVSNVHRAVQCLAERGAVEILRDRARSIRIVGEDSRYRTLATGRLRTMRDAIDAEIRRRAI